MRHTQSFGRFLALLLFLATTGPSALPIAANDSTGLEKLDRPLRDKAAKALGRSRVIVRGVSGVSNDELATIVRGLGGNNRRALRLIGAGAADLPDGALAALASDPRVAQVSEDRLIVGAMERTAATVGATAVRRDLGYDGAGVGVAIIDSGAAAVHDDLMGSNGAPVIDRFVDFVAGQVLPYDDYGHGTHVAGIIAGNGYDSDGKRSGIAPGVRLTVLKVLDDKGNGYISDVIAALEYVVANKDELNIRVVNLSVATGVYESYTTDPLTVAAESVVQSGVVVVAAAGNNGRSPDGRIRHGGVTAPGNAPSVLTVGASSHMGTVDRDDDTVASFSSRGPAAIDYGAKPDLVAPGVGIESLSDADGTLYSTKSKYLLPGTVATTYLPYLSLSGTSMAAPVVAGTVALMLEANPSLTPNAVKAILQYTAERHGYDPLTEGAGFLNALGAVQLAQYLLSPSGSYPDTTGWSRKIMWGNQLVRGGRLTPNANAWGHDVVWGSSATPGGQSIEWGVKCTDATCASTFPWRLGQTYAVNVVWGQTCGGSDCQMAWTGSVYGLGDEGDTVVWGTGDEGDTVVWGTGDEGDTVVWGTGDDGDTVVWGTSCSDPDCEPVIWKVQ
jgi:serine protease AprX